MSYEIMNIHIEHGCPAGGTAGFTEVAEWVGDYVRELEEENQRLREIERLYNEALGQEPVAVVVREPDYWSGGHFYKGTGPHVEYNHLARMQIGDLIYTAPVPQAPAVPDEMYARKAPEWIATAYGAERYAEGWNDCRKAMLAAAPEGGE